VTLEFHLNHMPDLPELRVGDCVRVLGGEGPNMLVDEVIRHPVDGQVVRCLWVDEQGLVHFTDHRADNLELAGVRTKLSAIDVNTDRTRSFNGATAQCDHAHPLTILVVEDNEDGANCMATLLRLYGHRVQVAPNGRSALELAAETPPDVALLDIGLPDLNGWEIARWLNEQAGSHKKLPFLIAITGYTSELDRQRSRKAGIGLHLNKPVDPAELVAVLERFRQVIAPTPQGDCG